MPEIKLHLSDPGPPVIDELVIGQFSDQEMERLKSFVQFVARVRASTILQRGLPAITNMNWNANEGMKFSCPPVANAELYELLHVLRPLILQSEHCSFHNIASLFGARFESTLIRNQLKELRRFFEDGELSLYMQIRVGDTPLFSDRTLKLWLNSEEYHTDLDKAQAWKELEESLSIENTRALVISLIQSKVKALFRLEYLVNLVLSPPSSP
jgi:hypothetical protein